MWKRKYEESMCHSIIACARNGGSVISRCVEIEIVPRTYYRWIDPNSEWHIPEFAEAHEVAEVLCQKWWEEKGQQHITFHDKGERLDPQNYRLQMANRFGWSEKTQQDLQTSGDIIVNLSRKDNANGNG